MGMQQKSELPEGWIEVSLGDISIKITDGTHHSPPNSPEGDFKYITAKNIKNDGVDLDNLTFVSSEVHNEIYSRCNPEYGDLLLIKDGATTGIVTLNNLTEPFSMLSSVALLKFPDKISNKYIMYYIRSPDFQTNISEKMGGVAITRLTLKKISSMVVALPPLAEQHRIVSAIEPLFYRLDVTNEKLDRVPEILKKFRESVLAAACEGRLTEVWREENQGTKFKVEILDFIDLGSSVDSEVIFDTFNLPDTWKWTTVDSIGHVKGGKRLQKGSSLVNYDTSHPYLRAGNLKNGTVEGEILYLQPNDYNQISKYTISSSDIYITIVGACIGDSGIVPEEYDGANLTENAAKVCDLRGICNQYLALVFQSKIIQDQIQNKIFSASQGKLALSRIRQFLISLPPLPEQQEIVRRVNALFAFADSIEAKVAAAREKTERLRQSILSKAFSGELVETEAEIPRREGRGYETAEVLMERIKAEKRMGGKKR
jgi:type I restriction enzyme S subunit